MVYGSITLRPTTLVAPVPTLYEVDIMRIDSTWPAHRQHMVSTWSAHGQHMGSGDSSDSGSA